MYSSVLILHSFLRWLVLGLGIAAVLRAAVGGRGPWTPLDEKLTRWFVISLDVQFLLGLLLYLFLSPFTMAAFADFGGAMRQSGLRFWAVEHPTLMVAALAIGHVARVRIRKALDDRTKHRRSLVLNTLALVAVVAAIPWPGMPNGRPLFRLG